MTGATPTATTGPQTPAHSRVVKCEFEDPRVSAEHLAVVRRDDDGRRGQEPAVVERLSQLGDLLSRDADTLKNSPGRKAIGFLCGHREFCPFADSTPLLRPEILQMLGQNNPLVQQLWSSMPHGG